MAYSYPEVRSFQGLFLQQNSFQVPDGAMEIASKVVIKSDEVIAKSNGLYEYWRPNGISPLDSLRATYTYQQKLVGFFATGIGYFTDTFPFGGTFNAVGALTANAYSVPLSFDVSTTFSEQNSNLYFTADQGVYKIESYSGKSRRAGIPPGLGLEIDYLTASYSDNGILPANSQTAYRYLIGRRDANGNLLLGAPSDILTIGVPPKKVGAAYTITGGTLKVTYPDNYFVQNYHSPAGFGYTFSAIGSNATNPLLNTVLVGNNGAMGAYLEFATTAPNGSGTIDLTFSFKPHLVAQIPSEIDNVADEYFIQLYRSSSSDSATSAPFPDFALVNEVTLSANDLLAGQIFLFDDVDPLLVGAQLYTNPNTREGPLQENSRPPKAKYIAHYKGHAVFANIISVQRTVLNMANPLPLNTAFHPIDLIFRSGASEEIYRPVYNSIDSYTPGTVSPRVGTVTAVNPVVINIGTAHTFPVGSKLAVLESGTSDLLPGEYNVTAVGFQTMTLNTTCTTTGTAKIQVVADNVARLFNGQGVEGISFTTIAEWTEYVAKDLVRAINGNPASFMYANYRSAFDEFPGTFSLQSKDYIAPIYVRYSAAPASQVFVQNIPSSFSTGIQFYSESDVRPNLLYVSKVSEPEAVPVVNFFSVGSQNSAIVGIFPLKDSLIILKEDGVFKLVGDIVDQFSVTPLDATVQFNPDIAKLATTINNTVIAFCNQGVVQITESSVQVISRRIEDVIQPLMGRDLSSTFLASHESERLVYVQTIGLNPGDQPITWVYNVLNQTWTSDPDVFKHLGLGPDNALVGIRQDATLVKNTLWRQRKTNTRVDWCGAYVVGQIQVDPVTHLTGTFTATGGNIATPAIGDVILAQNIFNRITAVTPSGGSYILTFAQMTAIDASSPQQVVLYKAYESRVKMAPFHAGQVGRSKHYAQFQVHLRQQVLTDLVVEFAGAYYGSSEITEWKSLNVSTAGAQGWGFSPWGLFPWGLVDGANLVAGTEPANIIRMYVPRFAARNTFIQPIMTHSQAAQPMMIQALSYSVHGYGERTSR